MKLTFLTIGISLFSTTAYSQIGINTPTPSAALDIAGKGSTGTTKALEVNNSNATEMVTVLDNGNVGINTSAPTQKLTVVDPLNTNSYNGTVSILSADKTLGVGIGNAGIQAVGSNTNNNIHINGKGSGNIILQHPSASTGGVGINISNPASKFNMINGRMIVSAGANPDSPLSNGWHDLAAPANTAEGVILRLVNTSPVAVGNTSIIGFNSYNGGGATWGIGSRQISTTISDSKLFIGWSNGGSYLERMTMDSSGNLTIQGTTATKPGGGSWTAASDARVKKEINPYTDGLEQLLQIKPVVFKYNGKGDTKDDQKKYIGVIAQDIEKIAPYAVTETDIKVDNSGKGMLQLTDAGSFTYMTINAIREQQAMIEAQQKEITELKKILQQQQAAINRLTEN